MIRYQVITFSAFLKVMFEIQISYNIIDNDHYQGLIRNYKK